MSTIRVLLTKSAIDEHDRGIRLVAAKLRDAGMEVIYTPFMLPKDAVSIAVQEDVDAVGLSTFAGGHLVAAEGIVEGLRLAGMADVVVVAGGIIPTRDHPRLKELGVAGIFGPGTPGTQIVEFIRGAVKEREAANAARACQGILPCECLEEWWKSAQQPESNHD